MGARGGADDRGASAGVGGAGGAVRGGGGGVVADHGAVRPGGVPAGAPRPELCEPLLPPPSPLFHMSGVAQSVRGIQLIAQCALPPPPPGPGPKAGRVGKSCNLLAVCDLAIADALWAMSPSQSVRIRTEAALLPAASPHRVPA